jgi:hypothetical protein
MSYEPLNSSFAEEIKRSFAEQAIMVQLFRCLSSVQ